MAFHPERLTGRRARRYASSLNWTPLPSKIPETLKKLVRRPEHIRAWAMIRAESGRYHYVVLIRNRMIFPSHHLTRKQTQAFRELATLGADTSASRCVCDEVLESWASCPDGHVYSRLPPAFQDIFARRKPTRGEEVYAVDRTDGRTVYKKRNPELDSIVHPYPWIEPDQPHLRWTVPRSQNGSRREGLSYRVGQKFLTVLRTAHARSDIRYAATNYYEPLVAIVPRSPYLHPHKPAKSVEVYIKWAVDDPTLTVQVNVNLVNWYSRAFVRGRTTDGHWVVLTPAASSRHPDDPVLCDAISTRDIDAALEVARQSRANPPMEYVSYMQQKATKGKVPCRIVPGLLVRDPAGFWRFLPVPTTQWGPRVVAPDQLVPGVFRSIPAPA